MCLIKQLITYYQRARALNISNTEFQQVGLVPDVGNACDSVNIKMGSSTYSCQCCAAGALQCDDEHHYTPSADQA